MLSTSFLTPIIFGPDVTSDIASLTQRPDDWLEARSCIEALRFYAQCLYQDESANGAGGVANNYFTQLERDGVFAQLAVWRLPIDVEGPAVKCFNDARFGCDGVEPLRLARIVLDRGRVVGVPIRKYSCDEPLQSAARCGLTLEQTADRVAQFTIALRELGQHEVDITFAYRANTVDEIIRFMERVQQFGATRNAWTSPTGVDIDFDSDSLHDQLPDTFWHHHVAETVAGAELQTLHHHCRAWGIPLRFIPTTRGNTPQTYRTGIADSFQYIRRLLGHEPDGWIFESWKGVPGGLPVNLPESDPLSHAGIVRDAAAGLLTP